MWHLIATGDLNVTKATAASIMAIMRQWFTHQVLSVVFIADRLLGQRRTVFCGVFDHVWSHRLVIAIRGTGHVRLNDLDCVGELVC